MIFSKRPLWGPLEPSGALWGLLGPSRALWGPLGPSGALWGPLGPSRALWGPSEALWGPLEPSGALWGPLGPSGALWGPLEGPLEPSGALSSPLGPLWGPMPSLGTGVWHRLSSASGALWGQTALRRSPLDARRSSPLVPSDCSSGSRGCHIAPLGPTVRGTLWQNCLAPSGARRRQTAPDEPDDARR